MKKKTLRILMCAVMLMLMITVTAIPAFAAGDVAGAIEQTWNTAKSQIQTVVNNADYIATRPRAERVGSHGLFTDDGAEVNLNEVSKDLNHYSGNVWTVIISLCREDAQRLGYDKGERWRNMLRSQTQALSEKYFNIF